MKTLALIPLLLLAGCVAKPARPHAAPDLRPLELELAQGYAASIVAEDLTNPSFVSFRPGSDRLTICDPGNGRVLLVEGSRQRVLLDTMATEYWKTLPDGSKAYRVGPLAALWLDENRLVVADSGSGDGKEALIVYEVGQDSLRELRRTNTVGPTSEAETDKGEGNFTGMCLMDDGKTVYGCSHGNDAKTWLFKADVETGKLEVLMPADDAGIKTNSPMQVIAWRGNLLVVYSGAGGQDDGLIVEWDIKAGKPLNQWTVAGLLDPMGISHVPGTDNEFAVTDNNWNLNRVNPGRIARVTLGESPQAACDVVASGLMGPVNCAFGPDGRLYVTCLGEKYDSGQGLVVAIRGFVK